MYGVAIKFENRVPGLAARLNLRTSAVPKVAAARHVQEARERVAVRTGFTRSTIRARNVNQYRTDVVAAGASIFLEFGTIRMSAQPFFLVSAEATRAFFLEEAATALKSL